MGFSDKLKELGDKAKDVATERKDQINQAVETAGTVGIAGPVVATGTRSSGPRRRPRRTSRR